MAQPPLSPEELKAPPLSGDAFMKSLHDQKTKKYPEVPPVYRAIAEGALERDYLDPWLKEAYYYWDNLYQSAGGVFVKINDEETRSPVLVKLVNIEGKELGRQWNGATSPAYEELWLRLAEGMGVPRAEVQAWKPFTRTHFAISTLILYSKGYEWTWLDGVASLYAGDLVQHECQTRAYQALKDHYKVPEESLAFFPNYLADTAKDIEWEEKALAYLCCTTERQHTAAKAFRERLDIEYQAAQGLWMAREAEKTGARLPARVP